MMEMYLIIGGVKTPLILQERISRIKIPMKMFFPYTFLLINNMVQVLHGLLQVFMLIQVLTLLAYCLANGKLCVSILFIYIVLWWIAYRKQCIHTLPPYLFHWRELE